jgi:hypothetical protein
VIYLAATYVDLNYYIESGHRLSGYMLEMNAGSGLAVKMVSDYLSPAFFLAFLCIALLALSGSILALGDSTGACMSKGVVRRWLFVALLMSIAGGLWCKPDSFVGSFPRNVAADSSLLRNLRSPMVPQDELEAGFKGAGIPLPRAKQGAESKPGSGRNLVLVVLESMPNIHLSLFGGRDETQPRMREYVGRMERYPNVFCSWPTSNHARTTVWSGLYPIRPFLSVVNPMIGRSSLTEILADAGYFNAFFYSSDKNYTRLNDYLGHRGIDLFEDSKTMGQDLEDEQYVSWGVREDVTLDSMKRFLDGRGDQSEPFSMIYIPACPHMPYDTIDERFDRFDEGGGPLDGNFTGAFKNQLLYMDWILSSLISHLDESGLLENTVVVMINDHGERVDAKNGGLGHGWSAEPVVASIPLMVFSPGAEGAGINPAIGSQVDVLPTILDYLDIGVPSNLPLQGTSLKNGLPDARRIYLGSYRDYAVIEGNLFYWLPNGDLSSAMCFEISNDGARSLFKQLEEQPPGKWAELEDGYGRFRILQESLIKHYDEYSW